jgi:hypothetical protein
VSSVRAVLEAPQQTWQLNIYVVCAIVVGGCPYADPDPSAHLDVVFGFSTSWYPVETQTGKTTFTSPASSTPVAPPPPTTTVARRRCC